MFENLGWWEILVLMLLAMFIFGPERLPKMIADASRMLRQVRQMARNATADLREELGTDLELEDLNPRTFVRKHLLSDEDQELIARPLRDAFGDLKGLGASVRTDLEDGAPGRAAAPAPNLTKKPDADRSATDSDVT